MKAISSVENKLFSLVSNLSNIIYTLHLLRKTVFLTESTKVHFQLSYCMHFKKLRDYSCLK